MSLNMSCVNHKREEQSRASADHEAITWNRAKY